MNFHQQALVVVFILGIILSLSPANKSVLNKSGSYCLCKFNVCTLVLLSIALLIMAVTRPEEMADYSHYVYAFGNDFRERFEPTFFVIKEVTLYFNGDHIGFFFIYALLSIGIKAYCISKMSDQIWTSFLIWISASFILMDMITIRASVACALMLLALKFKVDKKNKCFIITLLIAFLFHYSAAILFIILPFISNLKSHRIFYIIIIPFCFLLQIAGLTISRLIPAIGIVAIQGLYSGYSDDSQANLLNFLTLGRCAVAIILWINLNNWKGINPYALVCVKAYTIGCALFMLFGDLLRVGFRFAELMWCADIIAYTMLAYLFRKKNLFIPILICCILFFITVTKQSYWEPIN